MRVAELDPDVAALARAARESGLAAVPDLGVAQLRARVVAGNGLCADGPPVVVDDRTVSEDAGPLRIRTYEPATGVTDRAIVYLHGGGWVTGDLDYADGLCRHLAAGCAASVVSVDYRLAPEHPFPAAAQDAWTALCWTAGAYAHGGGLLVAGDSAGGGLAAGLAARARGSEGPAVTGQVLIYPALDARMDTRSYAECATAFPLTASAMEWFWEQYAPRAGDRYSALASPGRVANLAGLPPTILVQAGHDPLRDEGESYAERARAAGVPVEILRFPTLGHGFLRLTGAVAAARAALAVIVDSTAASFARSPGRSTS